MLTLRNCIISNNKTETHTGRETKSKCTSCGAITVAKVIPKECIACGGKEFIVNTGN